MFTKQYLQMTNFASEKSADLIEKLRNEDGEIASWMIVLAFLVAMAALAREEIGGAIETAIGDVVDQFDGGGE